MADFKRPLLSTTEDGQTDYGRRMIPSFEELKEQYNQKWAKEKEDFQVQLKANFFNLVERQAEGKQEIFMLSVPERKEKLYKEYIMRLGAGHPNESALNEALLGDPTPATTTVRSNKRDRTAGNDTVERLS